MCPCWCEHARVHALHSIIQRSHSALRIACRARMNACTTRTGKLMLCCVGCVLVFQSLEFLFVQCAHATQYATNLHCMFWVTKRVATLGRLARRRGHISGCTRFVAIFVGYLLAERKKKQFLYIRRTIIKYDVSCLRVRADAHFRTPLDR